MGGVTALVSVLLGSALGGMARFALAGAVTRRLGPGFPWGTLVVNTSGAFLAGLAAALLSDAGATASTPWLLGVIGLLGSYTTVSSFSLETLSLARAGRTGAAAGNVALSLLACLGAAGLGVALGVVTGGDPGVGA